MKASFDKLKDGQLNAYELGCGYVQKWRKDDKFTIQLWIEGGHYHVMRNDIDPTTNNTQSFHHGGGYWNVFDTLTDARHAFKAGYKAS